MEAKIADRAGFEPWTSQSLTRSSAHSAIRPISLLFCKHFYLSNKLYFGVRAIEITQKGRRKARKSHKSQRMFKKINTKTVKQKICIKMTNTFTIIATNLVREQLITLFWSLVTFSLYFMSIISNLVKRNLRRNFQ